MELSNIKKLNRMYHGKTLLGVELAKIGRAEQATDFQNREGVEWRG